LSSPVPPEPPNEETVPLFGSWRRAYTAVVVCNLLVLGLLFLFSRWPF